jgi:3-oxoacyl-[acyl-carrier-protein] synthase-3
LPLIGIEVPIDLYSACSTFRHADQISAAHAAEMLPPYILHVGAESTTKVLIYPDRNSAVLFGDGASAAIVSQHFPREPLLQHEFDARPSGGQNSCHRRLGFQPGSTPFRVSPSEQNGMSLKRYQ